MRTGWILITAILITVMTLGRTAIAADVHAYVTVSGPGVVYAAKEMAGAIFKKVGVTVEWPSSFKPIPGEPGVWLQIRLAEDTPNELLPGALAISYPFAGCSKSIIVFADRVRAMAESGFGRHTFLLAYVLVHEITHVLQGVDRHAPTGVMKASWSLKDRIAIYRQRLDFPQEDIDLIRLGLAKGACQQTTLIGQSAPGSARHPE